MTRRSLAIVVGVVSLCGCIDPKSDYEDFAARPLAEREAGMVDVQKTPCEELIAADPSALYYASCLPKDLPIPFALAIQQKVTSNGDGASATMQQTFTPLKVGATNISDTTGDPTTLMPVPLASDCTYTENIGTLTLGAMANSLGRDLQATDVVLRGKLLTVNQDCAELDGKVDLIMLNLNNDGDVCVFFRPGADGSLPTIGMDQYVCDPGMLPPR